MKDETKSIHILVPVVLISLVCARISWSVFALDKKIDSIFHFTNEVRLTLFEDTCHKQGGIYSETKDGGRRCDKIEAYKSRAEFECPEDTSKPIGFTVTTKDDAVAKIKMEKMEKQRSECLKWREAQDILRKKNYKEYACKTLDTFEDYLACNEK